MDRGKLAEFSVVYTDRTVNLMSSPFSKAYQDVQGILNRAYNGHNVVLIPGSGTFAMESAARAFGKGKKCMVIRLGYFSFRWNQILDAGEIASEQINCFAFTNDKDTKTPQFQPPNLQDVVDQIIKSKPSVLFVPHVDTATGIMLSDTYIRTLGETMRSVDGILVLDCIASGALWCDMKDLNVDCLIGAPQKAWSSPAGFGIVVLSEIGRKRLLDKDAPKSSSFSCDLKKWLEVSDKYRDGSFLYYTTLPTEAIMRFRDSAVETEQFGLENAREKCAILGKLVRASFKKRGFVSVAAPGFEAPGVVVIYDTREKSGNMFGEMKQKGFQVAGPVPFMLGPSGENLVPTFRIGLFGLDKWYDVKGTDQKLMKGIDGKISSL